MNHPTKSQNIGILVIGLSTLLLAGAGCANKAATTGVGAPEAIAPAGSATGEAVKPAPGPATQPAKRPTTGTTSTKPVETITQGETAKLPKEFPASFPIMPGARLAQTYSLVGGNVLALTAEWSLDKLTVDDAIAFYRGALPSKGWKAGELSQYVGAQVMAVSSGSWSGNLTFGSKALPFVKVELNFKK